MEVYVAEQQSIHVSGRQRLCSEGADSWERSLGRAMDRRGQMAAAYVGAVVGAGFATGQEVLTFFVVYGCRGLLGIVLVTLGFCAFGALSFSTAQELQVASYKNLLQAVGTPLWARFYDITITCFLTAGAGVMLAGAGSLVEQQWRMPAILGVGATAVITGISCYTGTRGIFLLNGYLVPVMAASVISLGLVSIDGLWQSFSPSGTSQLWSSTPSPLLPNWWIGALTYLSYNSILGVSACTPLAASLPHRKWAVWAGVVGGLALGLMLLSSSLAIWNGDPQVVQLAVPLLRTASQVAPGLGSIYGVIIWFAMLTTAANNLYAVIARLGRQPTPGLVGGLLVLSFALSLFGFSSLIQLLYPFFGYLGCCCWLQMIIYRWRSRFLMRRK